MDQQDPLLTQGADSVEQIVAILKQAEVGIPVAELIRQAVRCLARTWLAGIGKLALALAQKTRAAQWPT